MNRSILYLAGSLLFAQRLLLRKPIQAPDHQGVSIF